jgi:hypothetical protein
LQVVGGHLGRRDHHPLFTGERFFPPAVEEEGYVRILLCLGGAQVAQIGLGKLIAE